MTKVSVFAFFIYESQFCISQGLKKKSKKSKISIFWQQLTSILNIMQKSKWLYFCFFRFPTVHRCFLILSLYSKEANVKTTEKLKLSKTIFLFFYIDFYLCFELEKGIKKHLWTLENLKKQQ